MSEKRRGEDDPLIRALFDRLPPPGAPWNIESQAVWLKTLSFAFSLLYMPGDAPEIKISVAPPKDEKQP